MIYYYILDKVFLTRMNFEDNLPDSLPDAINKANAHLNTHIPANKRAMLADFTTTNLHKLSLEIFAGPALNNIRNTQVYRDLRARMEQIYLAVYGDPLQP